MMDFVVHSIIYIYYVLYIRIADEGESVEYKMEVKPQTVCSGDGGIKRHVGITDYSV